MIIIKILVIIIISRIKVIIKIDENKNSYIDYYGHNINIKNINTKN